MSLSKDRARIDQAWWREKLDALVTEARGEAFDEFATDRRRPETPSGKHCARLVEQLDNETAAILERLAAVEHAGMDGLMLTLLAGEVRRRDGRCNLIVGFPASTARNMEVAEGSDCLLPVILTGGSGLTLAEQFRATQDALTGAAAHAGVCSNLLYREFRQGHPQERPGSPTSLFDIALTANPVGPLLAGNGPDLFFSYRTLADNEGAMELALLWNPDVYRSQTAQSWLSSFAAWGRWLADDTSRVNVPLPALLPAEEQLLKKWEQGPVLPRPQKRFHQLFESLADSHPHRVAVVTAEGTQSYEDLERQANQLAWILLNNGVEHEEPVAVLTDCTADLPATVLGIWKAGASYLPLALEQPPERLSYMAMDARARVLVVLDSHEVPRQLANVVATILRPEDWNRDATETSVSRPSVAGTSKDLAYIVYTSGTTGVPKGVMLQHDSLINAAYVSGEMFSLTPEDRFSLATTPGFDASLWELGATLLNGMALVPVTRALRDDPWAMKKWYKQYGVTVAFHAPSYLRVSQKMPFEGLRVLLCGGEAPNHSDARRHADHVAFWNVYGPTETCIFNFAEQISTHPDPGRPLPLGRPVANMIVSIRRENGDRVPPGELGEVWFSGTGLARGYLNKPELTARQFVETTEGRCYRSGDLGRWTGDGQLELAGRIDHQVKLHGQRVELDEIDHALLSHPTVEEAVTLVAPAANDTKALWSFVRLRADAAMPGEEEWRTYLSDRLPRHMIPASVTPVESIPLTFAGKIDSETLRGVARRQSHQEGKHPPSGELEIQIAALWEELLGESVSREDNFFALGGNSLLAVTIAHRLSCDLARPVPARELFAAPTLAGFAHGVAELLLNPPSARGAPILARSDVATEGQREFRVAEAAGLDTRTFTITVRRKIVGAMPSLERWNQAWASLVARHTALRTYFHDDAEERLRFAAAESVEQELETATQPDLGSACAFIRQRQAELFIMGLPPLWSAGLVEVADSGEHLFWLGLHHSVGDGRSIGIIVDELGALMRGEELPPLSYDFAESAAREEAYLAGPGASRDADYWRELLAGLPDAAFDERRLDYPRSISAKMGTHRFETLLAPAVAHALMTIARKHNASMHAVVLTLLALEARRRSGCPGVVIGTAASTRETADEAQVIGYYVNMLPVAFQLPRDVEFGTALCQTQKVLAAALQHARYPFARIYRDFRSERPRQSHPTRYPLFDLAVIETAEQQLAPAGLRLARSATPSGYERSGVSPGQDMVLIHERHADGGLLLEWHVNAALYTRETANAWLEALRGWAIWLADDPERRVRETRPALLPREAALLEEWEHGEHVPRPALRFHELFERVLDASDQCGRPAVVTETDTTTYESLERAANAIAHCLVARGASPGMVVGVLTGRSAKLPAAVLGIWKAGATYLPLAADLPPERLAFMARDARVAVLIALDGLAIPGALGAHLLSAVRPDKFEPEFASKHSHRLSLTYNDTDAADAAYIVYTSGSTGQPKGTLIGHAAFVNSVLGSGEILGLTRDDRSLMFSSPSFDVSLLDIGLPLAFGAALCPVPGEVVSSPNLFRKFLSRLSVTVADVTPTYLRLFDGAALPSLRILVTGGEAPIAADVEFYAGRLQYFNAYGPTENTISSTMGRLHAAKLGFLAGGRPLPNTSVHVCDPEGNAVPPGEVGELWLGGRGLASGYIGRPDLTAAAFRDTSRGRRYRSGDSGRWRPTGELEILGRIDDQVKLNGIRIELGEVEHAIASRPGISQAVAVLTGDAAQGQSLWAFVRALAGAEAPAEGSWHAHLMGRLPEYMIPSAVITIPEIPLSNSGKVDKTALKMLLAGRSTRGGDSPAAGLETQIAGVWSKVLGGVTTIRRDDNFFALGGHSLLAIAVAHRLEEAFGHPVPARELFAEPTLAGFARQLEYLQQPGLPAERTSDRATEGQREFWVAEQAGLDTRGFNIPLTLLARGPAPDAEWRANWETLVRRHDALRTSFHEDGEGVLRRRVSSVAGAELELSTQAGMPAAVAHIRERQTCAFAMERAPLCRAGLVHVTSADQRIFWLVLHHSVGDGISLGVVVEELSALLQGATLIPLAGNFDQSAGREDAYLAGSACNEDAAYWRRTLGDLGDGSFVEWPLDLARPAGRTPRNAKGAHCFRVSLDARTASGLRDFAQSNGAGMHALLLAILAREVRRRTGRSEFLLGTAASTRHSVSEARVVGYYVNMLPLPCRIGASESVEQALQTMQQNLAAGLRHARYPFARMYADFRQEHAGARDLSRYPLFDFCVTGNPAPLPLSASAAFRSTGADAGYELRPNAPPQDMVLVHEQQPDGSLILQWYVNAGLYEQETAEAWFESLIGWARFISSSQFVPGAACPALLHEEVSLLAKWEHGPASAHTSPSITNRFEHWARAQPDRPALITEAGTQSYALLDARSNALAHVLLAEGVEPQERVGVFTNRSYTLPETVLAIWKAGACYVPLVDDLPAERLAFMIRDAGIRILVIQDGGQPPAAVAATGCKVLRPEGKVEAVLENHSHPPPITNSNLACILYTSGSTGLPKGVMLHHQGVNNLGMGMAERLGLRADDRVAQMASPGFDLWLSDLAMAWAAGAAIVSILRDELDDIPRLRDKLARLGVSTASMTPSYLRLFEQAEFSTLRLLMTVGEPPHRADANHYASRLRYINAYGPTENTACATSGPIEANAQRLTAGRPLPNTSAHILDSSGAQVPPGATGTIWLGGDGLALGYLNLPGLTDAAFVETPAGRRYRTGDLGRWTRGGELQVLGRSDGQVKMRGQRVELQEIEHLLESHPGVRQAVAIVDSKEDDTQTLQAFVCLDSQAPEPTQAAWRDYLAKALPSYMLPSAVLRLPSIPVSVSGKVDRAALLRVASEQGLAASRDMRGTHPHDGMEEHIAAVWAKHLDCRFIAREDNFFHLGGDSLRAIAAINHLRRTLRCTVNDLYEHPRLSDFAGVCRQLPGQLRSLIQSAARHWRGYQQDLPAYEVERDAALAAALLDYETRNQAYELSDLKAQRNYRHVLLTGATGYLGTYLLRELLTRQHCEVSVLLRGGSDDAAQARLGEALCHYFGAEQGASLRDNPRLTVRAGDLRREDLGLATRDRDQLAHGIQGIFHCAANVKHFGHSWEFQADNVAATARLLKLAAEGLSNPADLHYVSTLSVCGKAPQEGFRLFTEYDAVPESLDDNYYTRSKQEAERLVVAARQDLPNACIHRVGNLVFAARGGSLQRNIAENRFFRQLAAFVRLGVVPDDGHMWLCHVDTVARGIVRLACSANLTNETHHFENTRRDTVANFVTAAEGVRACAFDVFLQRLEAAVDEPEMDAALIETLENFGLHDGVSPQARARRIEIACGRTHTLLSRLGLGWPPMPAAGWAAMLREAAQLFAAPGDRAVKGGTPC